MRVRVKHTKTLLTMVHGHAPKNARGYRGRAENIFDERPDFEGMRQIWAAGSFALQFCMDPVATRSRPGRYGHLIDIAFAEQPRCTFSAEALERTIHDTSRRLGICATTRLRVISNLRPVSMGSLAGKTNPQLKEQYPDYTLGMAMWEREYPRIPQPPLIPDPDAEPNDRFLRRWQAGLEEACDTEARNIITVVSYSGSIASRTIFDNAYGLRGYTNAPMPPKRLDHGTLFATKLIPNARPLTLLEPMTPRLPVDYGLAMLPIIEPRADDVMYC